MSPHTSKNYGAKDFLKRCAFVADRRKGLRARDFIQSVPVPPVRVPNLPERSRGLD